MGMLRKLALIAGLVWFALPATAATIGVPVNAIGSSTQVGAGNVVDGIIKFYISLDGTEVFGVSGGGSGGLTQDVCFGAACGGVLNMFLEFSPVSTGANILTLLFEDLDLFGANDPSVFLESVTIISNFVALALVDQITDPQVVAAETDHNGQKLQLAVNVPGDPFWVRLKFKSIFLPGNTKTWRNTPEYLQATISPVPLPAAAWLFVTGVGAMGWLARRRKRGQRGSLLPEMISHFSNSPGACARMTQGNPVPPG